MFPCRGGYGVCRIGRCDSVKDRVRQWHSRRRGSRWAMGSALELTGSRVCRVPEPRGSQLIQRQRWAPRRVRCAGAEGRLQDVAGSTVLLRVLLMLMLMLMRRRRRRRFHFQGGRLRRSRSTWSGDWIRGRKLPSVAAAETTSLTLALRRWLLIKSTVRGGRRLWACARLGDGRLASIG